MHTAAAQRKDDSTNVLLASTNKTQPSTPSTPVAHLPNKSLPLVACVQLNMQPPPAKKSTNQHLNTPSGDEDYAPHINEEDDVVPQISNDPLLSNNLNEDEMAPLCAACQSCCNPNSDTDDYRFCINCNCDAQAICTEQMDFQTPASDKLVITHLDFCHGGKECYKNAPCSSSVTSHCIGRIDIPAKSGTTLC